MSPKYTYCNMRKLIILETSEYISSYLLSNSFSVAFSLYFVLY